MISVAGIVVVAGVGLFLVFCVQVISNRVLTSIGALLMFLVGFTLATVSLRVFGCTGELPEYDRMVVELIRGGSQHIDSVAAQE